jgi:hypothetical protein
MPLPAQPVAESGSKSGALVTPPMGHFALMEAAVYKFPIFGNSLDGGGKSVH